MASRRPLRQFQWDATSPFSEQLLAYAEERLKFIHRRKDELAACASHDPVWTLLLDLYVNAGRGRDVGVKSACVGSGAPSTTALRHLAALADAKIITYDSDPTDQRKRIVRLADWGARLVQRHLAAEIDSANKVQVPFTVAEPLAQIGEGGGDVRGFALEIEGIEYGKRRAEVIGGTLRCRFLE